MSVGRFERMVGISEDEYHHLKSLQQSQNPIQNKFLSLSNNYQKQASINDPHVRIHRQGETLNEMINLKDDLRKRLIEITPKPYQSRATSLFQFVANKIDVNEKGELKDAHGSVIQGSNISDLVQHAVRDRRRNILPPGWNTFLSVLRDNNTPRMILNYNTLEEMHSPEKIKTAPLQAVTRPVATPKKRAKRVKKEPTYLEGYVKK